MNARLGHSDSEPPIRERTPDEKAAYIEGMRAGIKLAAGLAPIYEGQSEIKDRIARAGSGMVDVMEATLNGADS